MRHIQVAVPLRRSSKPRGKFKARQDIPPPGNNNAENVTRRSNPKTFELESRVPVQNAVLFNCPGVGTTPKFSRRHNRSLLVKTKTSVRFRTPVFAISRLKKVLLLLAGLALPAAASIAQVSVTATAGVLGPTPYATLGQAFQAINAGTHQGSITVDLPTSTNEGAAPANLNGSGAGPASYTSVLIRPRGDDVRAQGLKCQWRDGFWTIHRPQSHPHRGYRSAYRWGGRRISQIPPL